MDEYSIVENYNYQFKKYIERVFYITNYYNKLNKYIYTYITEKV